MLLVIFLSTPSARRATSSLRAIVIIESISIHALREEGDTLGAIGFAWFLNFYPRPPRGGRLISALLIYSSLVFLSTPSARRATARQGQSCGRTQISIHALREEGDQLFARHGHR